MIGIEEAEKILKAFQAPAQAEEVSLKDALNRILADDLCSPLDLPPFDKSAMDGYAIMASDRSSSYRIVEVIPAGIIPRKKIGRGKCAKIMTGAMLPPGAGYVVKKEHAVEESGAMWVTTPDDNPNVCWQGEDLKKNDGVLVKGTRLRIPEISLLAALGFDAIKVSRKPRIGIVTTGSELVEPGHPIRKGQIYNSNAACLLAQIDQMGAAGSHYGTVADHPQEITRAIVDLSQQCDVIILSGGVSAGDFDYVPSVFRELGIQLHFEKVAIQPGMPTVFGTRGSQAFFGLPGNPVSTLVVFDILVKPFIFALMRHPYSPVNVPAILLSDYQRKKTERTAFVPVHYRDGNVQLVPFHGSAHIAALSLANALLTVPQGIARVASGSSIHVRLL